MQGGTGREECPYIKGQEAGLAAGFGITYKQGYNKINIFTRYCLPAIFQFSLPGKDQLSARNCLWPGTAHFD